MKNSKPERQLWGRREILCDVRAGKPAERCICRKTKDPQDTPKAAKKLEKLTNVYKVTYGQEQVDRLFKISNVAKVIGIALVIGLLFTAMFLISNTIKITILRDAKKSRL